MTRTLGETSSKRTCSVERFRIRVRVILWTRNNRVRSYAPCSKNTRRRYHVSVGCSKKSVRFRHSDDIVSSRRRRYRFSRRVNARRQIGYRKSFTWSRRQITKARFLLPRRSRYRISRRALSKDTGHAVGVLYVVTDEQRPASLLSSPLVWQRSLLTAFSRPENRHE